MRQAMRTALEHLEMDSALSLRSALSAQLAHPILRGERFPLNFGRTVVAALAGKPERADWKNCEASPAEEEKRTADFKDKFKAWDPM